MKRVCVCVCLAAAASLAFAADQKAVESINAKAFQSVMKTVSEFNKEYDEFVKKASPAEGDFLTLGKSMGRLEKLLQLNIATQKRTAPNQEQDIPQMGIKVTYLYVLNTNLNTLQSKYQALKSYASVLGFDEKAVEAAFREERYGAPPAPAAAAAPAPKAAPAPAPVSSPQPAEEAPPEAASEEGSQ